MSFEEWTSPESTVHIVPVIEDRGAVCEPVTGPCATCGRHHTVLHFRNARVFEVVASHGPCKTIRRDWPYECIAKDRNPDHVVFSCITHAVWWHEAP